MLILLGGVSHCLLLNSLKNVNECLQCFLVELREFTKCVPPLC